ncbi:MAG: hypothetical protein LBL36_02860, partial [Clostridiales Family XIII bacterium]|nr:hypothetical protein [Clostridiales Family XIII bacterium]
MKLPLLFIYFLLLDSLVFADGTRGSGPQHLIRLATGIDFETNQTAPYLLFAAICLYGVCIVRGA